MIFAALSLTDFLPFALFGLFAVVAWWVMGLIATGKSREVERLDELSNPNARRDRDATAMKKSDAMTRVLEKGMPALARPLQPKSEKDRGKLQGRLTAAGFRGETAPSIFLGLKFAGLLFGLFFGGGIVLALCGVSRNSLGASIGVAGFCFYLPDILIALIARSRRQGIFLGLPDALDLLVVCVEAGLGFDHALRKVADEMKKAHPIIGEEFGLCNFQLQMGRTRSEVLHELGLRTGVSDLRALSAVIIQADKFGSSIANALRVQSDSMRVRRRQIAEEKAAKTAVKLIFPLVLFIFPGIFVILVGPAAITMVTDFFPMMSGEGL